VERTTTKKNNLVFCYVALFIGHTSQRAKASIQNHIYYCLSQGAKVLLTVLVLALAPCSIQQKIETIFFVYA
jgi:hypothetical protein